MNTEWLGGGWWGLEGRGNREIYLLFTAKNNTINALYSKE